MFEYILSEHNEVLYEKSQYASMWETLTEELNKVGPPKNSVEKWKRIWSVFKYNNKTKFPTILGVGNTSQQGKIVNYLSVEYKRLYN